jgi:hypothetical protein
MKRVVPILLLVFVALLVVAMERGTAPNVGEHPVVVELFTSQGCSSCPPADELLRRISRDPQLRGRVIPLAFHVDYWNHLGWRDPFSSPEWSQRQVDYVRAMKLKSAYTPQVVINGARQMVGSSTFEVYRAIEEESRRAPAGTVSVTPSAGSASIRAQSSKPDVDLIVVTFENGAQTKVIRGENTGKTLANDAIVRSLKRIATLDGRKAVEKRVDVRPKHGVAAFLQERATRRIVAAAIYAP